MIRALELLNFNQIYFDLLYGTKNFETFVGASFVYQPI